MKGVTLLAGVLTALMSSQAFSSSDGVCGFSDSECGVSALPYLQPGNDTRANLMLLQSRLHNMSLPLPHPLPDQTRSRIDPFTAYRVMGIAATEEVPSSGSAEDITADAPYLSTLNKAKQLNLPLAVQGTISTFSPDDNEGRHISNALSTLEAFFDVLLADTQLTNEQRTLLAHQRVNLLNPLYTKEALNEGLASLPGEGHASALTQYLFAVLAFYQGHFDEAESGFQALTSSPQPWVAETSRYMLIRVAINKAMENALDEYNMFDASKADKAAAQLAVQHIGDYLKQYPDGQYIESANGLYRRAYWIMDDVNALATTYQHELDNTADIEALLELSDEIDNKLLENRQFTSAPGSPPLTMVQDLKRLRSDDGWLALPALSTDELAAQKPLFAQDNMQDAFSYLQAAQLFYGQKDYAAVVNSVPATQANDLTDTVRFSLQVLRGRALVRLERWDEAEAHWRQLLTRNMGYTQNQFLQLALAETLVKAGHPERIFAADSPVKNLRFRSAVLKISANADLLRQQTGPQQTHEERAIALHTLLTKSLTHGDYASYLKDVQLRKDIAPLVSSENQSWNQEDLTAFDWDGSDTEEDYQCPALGSVVETLNQRPNDARSINCLGEFFLRTNNSVGFDWGEGSMLSGLTNAPTQFVGTEYNRLDGYMRVIADPKAPPEDKTYALYRAVNCYAPSGYNDCGPQDISKATRKAWFTQLKTKYKGSVWADKLDYYW
ncbi:hypothetical protein [Pectobacterium versatile]|uniref:hypothetical protein n=1 Tax=Pectobacterium versatile TaxID=2488639 RepID=UPI00102F20BB|nr:hypothetical protein [Pectobacterium versatile]MBN3194998.1 hypothetical protein [Pectobacterium versatile]TAJ01154.1 hypothetical protein EG335_02175 [Pectobacterium versatile]